MPETRVNPAGPVADVARFLVENFPASKVQAGPGLPTVGEILKYLVPTSETDVVLSATPLGLVRKTPAARAIREAIGTGHGLTQREVLRMLDDTLGQLDKALRRKSTGEVFGPSRGMSHTYHDELVQETVDQGLVPYDAYDEMEHGYLLGEQYLSKPELDDAVTATLGRLFSR